MSGIPNVYANCYINSALQLILSSEKLSSFFDKEPYLDFLQQYRNQPIINNPMQILEHYFNLDKFAIKGRQGDAHEVLVYLLDDSKCVELCGIELVNNIIHNNTILRGSKNKSDILSVTKCSTLQKSLDTLFSEGDEFEFNDDEDENKSKIIKMQIVPQNTPEFIFLHIKRFEYNPQLDKFVKDDSDLEIDKLLLFNSANYDIIGFSVHIGKYQGGHYFTVSLRNGKWYKIDDTNVILISNLQVSNLAKKAYIFLLKREDVIDNGFVVNHNNQVLFPSLSSKRNQNLNHNKQSIINILDTLNKSRNLVNDIEDVNNVLERIQKIEIMVFKQDTYESEFLKYLKCFYEIKKFLLVNNEPICIPKKELIEFDNTNMFKVTNIMTNDEINEYTSKHYELLSNKRKLIRIKEEHSRFANKIDGEIKKVDDIIINNFLFIISSIFQKSVIDFIMSYNSTEDFFLKNEHSIMVCDIINYDDTERDIIIYDIVEFMVNNNNEKLILYMNMYINIYRFIFSFINKMLMFVKLDSCSEYLFEIIKEKNEFINNIETAIKEKKSIQDLLENIDDTIIDIDYVKLLKEEIDDSQI